MNRPALMLAAMNPSLALLLGMVCLAACTAQVSAVPLSPESEAEGYYYGDPTYGGKSAPSPEPTEAKTERPTKQKPKTPVDKQEDEELAQEEEEQDGKASEAGEDRAERPLDPVKAAAAYAGTYAGDDRVTIQFDGLPEQTQDDDQAVMRVTVEEQVVKVTVVDSNAGGDLCTVSGEPKGKKVVFKPGQSCFSEMLGGPVQTELTSGEAKLEGSTLTVDFTVQLEIEGPDDSLSGTLHYHFSGHKD